MLNRSEANSGGGRERERENDSVPRSRIEGEEYFGVRRKMDQGLAASGLAFEPSNLELILYRGREG